MSTLSFHHVLAGPLEIELDNQAGEDTVVVYCRDVAGARRDQCILGVAWECPADMNVAYAVLSDRPGIVDELWAEGYDVLDGCYYERSPAEWNDLLNK